ncbi:MAG: PepSY domain-containing protein [Maribacter sp.]|nr:PepSY domain-containing protein [Maribacter sp.]
MKIGKKRKLIYRARKWHRYLGLILGIQFLLWTLGGLYFSWTNIDEIRGDNLKNEKPNLVFEQDLVSPALFLNHHLTSTDSLLSLKLVAVLKEPFYEMVFNSKGKEKVKLINALNGKMRLPLNKEDAIAIAKEKLKVEANVAKVELLTETNSHHEYRERPLPAFAITFKAPASTTVYVSQDYGNVQTFRNSKWRIFDFLWMMHTMDYQERDDFNNWLLRLFSIFGLVTIFSGFTLYYLTSKKWFR